MDCAAENSVSRRLGVGLGPALRVQGGVNQRVEADGRVAPSRLGQVADDRLDASLLESPRSWLVAHQAGDRMACAHQRVEHRTADVAGGAREKDPQSLSNPPEGDRHCS